MTIIIQQGDNKIQIDADDRLIKDSITYQSTFERQVKFVLESFYKGISTK